MKNLTLIPHKKKIFRQINCCLVISLINRWNHYFHEIFAKSDRVNFRNFHTVLCQTHTQCGKTKVLCCSYRRNRKVFRAINSLVTFLVKTLLSWIFFPKSVRVNFRNLQTVLSSVHQLHEFSEKSIIFFTLYCVMWYFCTYFISLKT